MFDEGLDKGMLAMVSGVGFTAIVLFFRFFMWGSEYSEIYTMMFILITLSALVVFFYLLDELNFMYNRILGSDDPDGMKTNVKRGSNFISGIMLMTIAGLNIIGYTDYGNSLSLRLFIMTLLTIFSVFLLLYSMFMSD